MSSADVPSFARQIYAQVQQAEDTVTAHLNSIHKVTEEHDQVLPRLGLLKQHDAIIDNALQTNQQIMGILDAGNTADKTVKDLEGCLKI